MYNTAKDIVDTKICVMFEIDDFYSLKRRVLRALEEERKTWQEFAESDSENEAYGLEKVAECDKVSRLFSDDKRFIHKWDNGWYTTDK